MLQANKTYIYLLFITIFLSACSKEPLTPIDSGENQSLHIINIPITVSNAKYTKLRTDNKLHYTDIGGYKHYTNTSAVLADYVGETGSIKTAFYSQVMLPENNFSFGDKNTIKIDSAYIAIDYLSDKVDSTFYGDTDSKFIFEVNEIMQDLDSKNVPYFSDQETSYSSDNISAGEDVSIAPGTKIKVPNIEDGKKLGDKEVDSHIRIKLDNNYILNKLLLADSSNFKDQTEFAKYFKGFRISASKQNGKGGLISFSTYDYEKSPIRLIIYYREEDASGSYYKEAELAFANASESSNGIFYTHINNILSDTILADTANIYLVPLAGLASKLDFSNLYTAVGSNKNKVVINQAILTAEISSGSDTNRVAQALIINRGHNKDGNSIDVPDGSSDDYRPINSLDGLLRKTDKQYKFNLQKTTYDLITENIKDNSIYLDFKSPQNAINITRLRNNLYLKVIYSLEE